MDFPFGQTLYRDRRARVTDPYNSSKTTEGDWDPDQTIELANSFVAASSSNRASDATRVEVLTAKSLYLSDPTVDVQVRDRIRTADMDFDSGTGYAVSARPDADINPFTGWQPVIEIPLELVEG